MLLGFKIVEDIKADMEREGQRVRGAMGFALKRAAFEARTDMQKELRENQLGLKPVANYRNDPRRNSKWPSHRRDSRQPKRQAEAKRAPLKRFAPGIRYSANISDSGQMVAEIGFIATSAKWMQATAIEHAAGYMIVVNDRMREVLHHQGIHLRKSTTSIMVPRRDIADSWYARQRDKTLARIREIFEIKMAGGRV